VRNTFALVQTVEVKQMKQVDAQKRKAIAASLPPFSDFDGVLAYVFPFTTRQCRTTRKTFSELAPDFNWDDGGCPWAEKDWLDISMSYIPSNLDKLLPADQATQEWPFNFARWAIAKKLGMYSKQLRSLLPVIKNELEAIIEAYDCIENERDRKLIICRDIHMMLLKLVYYFTPPKDIEFCLERVEWWTNYMKDVAGCIDCDGVLDREQAAMNSICREWGIQS
jgi:hypothetical protein